MGASDQVIAEASAMDQGKAAFLLLPPVPWRAVFRDFGEWSFILLYLVLLRTPQMKSGWPIKMGPIFYVQRTSTNLRNATRDVIETHQGSTAPDSLIITVLYCTEVCHPHSMFSRLGCQLQYCTYD